MPADYEKIRADNIRRYGWDTAVLDLLGQLYSERTHFIFELIQNAEDAGATELAFELFGDRLEVRHDGRPFTEADVRGVCGVGKSSKTSDLTKIGKFGIGFKAVYAYTKTPRIHSSGEHFRIENYVRPFPADPPDERSDGTLFVFPFDHDSVPAQVAVAEISAALGDIDASILLFLRNIVRLRVGGHQVAAAVLERVTAGRTDSSRHITLTDGRRRGTREWFVWQRQLDAPGLAGQRVEIAFRADVADGKRALVTCDASPLVVFFPTQKETFLGFWIQGPYRTTPARDNVPSGDPSNQALVRQTAALLVDVLAELRDDGLLTVEVLQALPLDVARFGPGTMFRPLFESVRTVLADEQMLPLAAGVYGTAAGDYGTAAGDYGTAAGGYGTAAQLRLADGAGLRELFSPDQLGAIYAAGQPLAFADEGITDAATPVLWRYLREEIGIGEVTPDAVVGRLTAEFLMAQSDAWIGRLYAYLYQNSVLWREPRFPGEQPGPARTRPVIRLEDGTHIAPFDSDDRPAAYLPSDAWTGLPTVRRAIADIHAARQFLDALKLTEPDVVAEVLENILPRYASMDIADLDAVQHDIDLECVALALAQAAPGRRQQLVDRVRQTAFLVGENAGTGERRLMTPAALYERAKDLEVYFDGNPDAWFADDAYGPWLTQLRGMGVRDSVWLRARDPNHLGHVVTFDEFARHERGIGGFDPAAQLDGLDFALGHPNHARSEYVWNVLLVANRHLVAGVVEKSARQEFADASRSEEKSPIGTAATAQAWLPSPDGAFCRPAEIRPDDLPPAYKRDEALAKALGMVTSMVDEVSRQLGIPADVLRGLSEHPDLVLRIEQELKSRSATAQEPPPEVRTSWL